MDPELSKAIMRLGFAPVLEASKGFCAGCAKTFDDAANINAAMTLITH
jgi:hypothetical protein